MKLRLLRLGGERQPDKPERDPKCGPEACFVYCPPPRGSGRSKTKVAHDSCSGTSSLNGRPMSPLGHQRRFECAPAISALPRLQTNCCLAASD